MAQHACALQATGQRPSDCMHDTLVSYAACYCHDRHCSRLLLPFNCNDRLRPKLYYFCKVSLVHGFKLCTLMIASEGSRKPSACFQVMHLGLSLRSMSSCSPLQIHGWPYLRGSCCLCGGRLLDGKLLFPVPFAYVGDMEEQTVLASLQGTRAISRSP